MCYFLFLFARVKLESEGYRATLVNLDLKDPQDRMDRRVKMDPKVTGSVSWERYMAYYMNINGNIF